MRRHTDGLDSSGGDDLWLDLNGLNLCQFVLLGKILFCKKKRTKYAKLLTDRFGASSWGGGGGGEEEGGGEKDLHCRACFWGVAIKC